METTATNRTIGGMVIAAIILTLLLVLFSCTVNSDLVGAGGFYQDEKGYVVPVEVSKDARIPPDWTCYTQKSSPEKLLCDVRVEGAQGPSAKNLTEQEVRSLVQEEVDRIREITQAEPKQKAEDHSSEAPQRDWFDWSAALANWAAVGLAALTLFTQRKRLPTLIARMRRSITGIRRRVATRKRAIGIGPGPLYHPRGRRPARNIS